MSKGIAIRTILLLLVGVVAASIIIYLVYSLTRSPALTAAECQARLVTWCTACKNEALAYGGTYQGTGMGKLYSDCKVPLEKVGIILVETDTCNTESTESCPLVGIEPV